MVFKRLPWAFSKDLESEAKNSAPSSKRSGGHTCSLSKPNYAFTARIL